MQLQVTQIEFDFEIEDDDFPSQEYQQQLTEEVIGSIWEVDDEEELTDEITNSTGWCIKSIDYRHILS